MPEDDISFVKQQYYGVGTNLEVEMCGVVAVSVDLEAGGFGDRNVLEGTSANQQRKNSRIYLLKEVQNASC